MVFLSKMHTLNLITRKHQEKPKLRGILQNNWPVVFKNARPKKRKAERNFTLKRWKKMTAICNIRFPTASWHEGKMSYTCHYWDNWLNFTRACGLIQSCTNVNCMAFDDCIVFMEKNVQVLRKHTLKHLRVKGHDIYNLLSMLQKKKMYIESRWKSKRGKILITGKTG